MCLTRDDNRGFTSAKYLSKYLTEMGYPKSTKSVLPYIAVMIEMGIIEPSENKLKPYTILKNKDEIEEMINNLHNRSVNRRYAGDGI